MAKEFDIDIEQDPEVYDDLIEGTGDDSAYDQKAVETVEYDPEQFELPDDFVYEADGEDD